MGLSQTSAENISENLIKLLGKDWMLICAGNKEKYNMMTASWGGFGVIWGKNVCYIVVRPSRYTYEFLEKTDAFTLNFFEEKHRKALKLCGSKSGRDIDKMKEPMLTPVEVNGTIYFAESKLVIVCKKLYHQDLIPENFLDREIETHYNGSDYHRMYIGEIKQVLQED